jgi:hypothetical protein
VYYSIALGPMMIIEFTFMIAIAKQTDKMIWKADRDAITQ